MTDFFPVYVYFGLVAAVTLIVISISAIFPSNTSAPAKFFPYESGILTDANLMQERFPIRHYLVALIFLVFDIEVIFLYPWAVVAHQLGAFAFYEMAFFLVILLVGLAYVWKKGGLVWE
jgi:NADH:ubiquinone oxidoreductase subunit 3 (subunit A)